MELRHLRYFVAVAEEENVTRAASRLHVSQPALSRQIRDLEEELNLELFLRRSRSLRLTEAGRVFLEETRAVLRRLEDAIGSARAVAEGVGGEIHVGFAPSLTVDLLPNALRRFQESQPGARVRLHDLSTQEMVDGLQSEELHVALMIRPSIRASAGIMFKELRRLGICVAVHPSHPLASARKVGLADVAKDRLIGYDSTKYPEYTAWLKKLFSKASDRPRIAEEHEGSTGLVAAVEAGRGVALVQEGFECFSGPRLTVRALSPKPTPFIVGIGYRHNLDSPAARAFIEAASE